LWSQISPRFLCGITAGLSENYQALCCPPGGCVPVPTLHDSHTTVFAEKVSAKLNAVKKAEAQGGQEKLNAVKKANLKHIMTGMVP
jgi:hypothetical protein